MESGIDSTDKAFYTRLTIRLHWIAACMIIGMMVTGMLMEDTTPTLGKILLLRIHVILGLATSLISMYRIWWHGQERKQGAIPPPPTYLSPRAKQMRNLVHLGLRNMMMGLSITGILGLLLSPLTTVVLEGVLGPYLDFEAEGVHIAHAILSKIYLLLFLLHIGGIGRSTLMRKGNPFARMQMGNRAKG